jgi:hypothetical protein
VDFSNFKKNVKENIHSSAPVSTGNMFQDLPWLCETVDNTERYIYRDIHITNINTVEFIDKLCTVKHYQH